MGIVAHLQVRKEHHFCAGFGQLIQRAHGDIDLIADAADIYANGGGQFLQQYAANSSYHGSFSPSTMASIHQPISRPLRTRRRPVAASALFESEFANGDTCAWQIAQARASAESGAGKPFNDSSRCTMC